MDRGKRGNNCIERVSSSSCWCLILENRNRNGHAQTSVLVICPLISIVNDQIFEVESMGLCACNLSEKLADLTEVKGGKYHIVYSSAESARDKRFLHCVFTTNSCLCGR